MKIVRSVLGLFGYVPFSALVASERDVVRLNNENGDLARRLNSLDEAHSHRLHALNEACAQLRNAPPHVTVEVQSHIGPCGGKFTSHSLVLRMAGKLPGWVRVRTLSASKKNKAILDELAKDIARRLV